MDKYTYIIYFLIVAVAVIASIVKRIRKANSNSVNQQKQFQKPVQQTTYQKPHSTQPKSLEDILQSLLNEQKGTQKTVPPPIQEPVKSDKGLVKSTTLETTETLENIEEEKYYGYDTELAYDEETEDYDLVQDHRNHSKGFDNEQIETEQEVGEWADIDWRKAVITAEILKRPEY